MCKIARFREFARQAQANTRVAVPSPKTGFCALFAAENNAAFGSSTLCIHCRASSSQRAVAGRSMNQKQRACYVRRDLVQDATGQAK